MISSLTSARLAYLSLVPLWLCLSGCSGCGTNGLSAGGAAQKDIEELVGADVFDSLSCDLYGPLVHKKYPCAHPCAKELRGLVQWLWSLEDVSGTRKFPPELNYHFSLYKPDARDQGYLTTSGDFYIYIRILSLRTLHYVQVRVYEPPRKSGARQRSPTFSKLLVLDHSQFKRIKDFLAVAVPEE